MAPAHNYSQAFCAGGDVRAVYDDGLANETGTAGLGVPGSITGDFFRKEYELNYMLSTFPKPQVCCSYELNYKHTLLPLGGCRARGTKLARR